MTITVEDGSIVADANSYVDEADLTAFASARGITLTTDEEQLLIRAMDYIEYLYYKGTKVSEDQSLQWPRTGVYIDGYLFSDEAIPKEIKEAQMQCAIAIDQGNDPLQDLDRKVVREKVGNLEVQYSESSVVSVINKKIMNTIKKLLASGNGYVLDVTKG